ncbi:MAG: DUF4258 domain-containing protein [Chloroflexia bacterium]|nr:DUF4258 domain-containing protein [Chloroflexia bacterium]
MEVFSKHARERMRARSISEHQVILTLALPDRRFRGSRGNMIAENAFGSVTRRVVYEDRRNASQRPYAFIITAMWK